MSKSFQSKRLPRALTKILIKTAKASLGWNNPQVEDFTLLLDQFLDSDEEDDKDVGPVEKSKSGNRLMLVVTDYARKYSEVFSLKSVKAKAVGSCLIQFLSRLGFNGSR